MRLIFQEYGDSGSIFDSIDIQTTQQDRRISYCIESFKSDQAVCDRLNLMEVEIEPIILIYRCVCILTMRTAKSRRTIRTIVTFKISGKVDGDYLL